MTNTLPIDALLPELACQLEAHNRCLLQAEPGAGKTTRVPLALLNQPWLGGQRILMLEPRRIAARSASRYMSAQLGEQPGGTVGHRTRQESRVGKGTRIEVITEGILTRMLQQDPALEGVGCVVLDEFHERNLNSDLALALLLEAQNLLREDLRLLVMSATLEATPLIQLLGKETPLLNCKGRSYPVSTHYLGSRSVGGGTNARFNAYAFAGEILRICGHETGSLLCFLPGVGEIRRTESALLERGIPTDLQITPLYGGLSPVEQDRAIQPSTNGRKLVLTTAIAESSLTIEGVRVVIDSGLMRLPQFDATSGMSRLITLPVSHAAAEQRRGRAGRVQAGACYRFWSEERQHQLQPQRPAEILSADLAPLCLELARWGTPAEKLSWLDPPPTAHLAQAKTLLQTLEALDSEGQLTPLGEQMLRFGTHPRLAALMLRGQKLGLGDLACEIAALLSEGARSPSDELISTLEAIRSNAAPLLSARQQAKRWKQQLNLPATPTADLSEAGLLLSFAFPDRVARRRGESGTEYQLANGRGAHLQAHSSLRKHPWLVCAELDGQRPSARIFSAAPVNPDTLAEHHVDRCRWQEQVRWGEQEQRIIALRERRFGALVLKSQPLDSVSAESRLACLLAMIRQRGLNALSWDTQSHSLCARVSLLRQLDENTDWPDLTPPALLNSLEDWLAPYLTDVSQQSQLQKINLCEPLLATLSWEQQQQLSRLTPTHITVPSGTRITIDYLSREEPVLAVKLQELFGLTETPCIANGRVPLLLELLSPARRPIQTTRDLANFWRVTYAEVKKDLKGRYPKHPWPDDPMAAEATALTKKQAARRSST